MGEQLRNKLKINEEKIIEFEAELMERIKMLDIADLIEIHDKYFYHKIWMLDIDKLIDEKHELEKLLRNCT